MTIDLTEIQFDILLAALRYATGAAASAGDRLLANHFLEVTNAVNRDNPNFAQFQPFANLFKCERCHDKAFICIHCDKNLDDCQCPDDGSRNPGSYPACQFPIDIDKRFDITPLAGQIADWLFRNVTVWPVTAATSPVLEDLHQIYAHRILEIVMADPHIYWRADGLHNVNMRGRLGYSCVVQVSADNAPTIEQARSLARLMFPELTCQP